MWPNVTNVGESRFTIWDPLEIYNLWVSLSGSGKTYVWTSLWVYLAPRVCMTLYGSLWIIWRSHLTSYLLALGIGSDSMQSWTLHTLSSSRHSDDHHLRQRIYLFCSFLRIARWVPWHPSYPKFSISSSNWRSDQASESNHWRYASRLHLEWWPKVGPTSSTGRVLIQQ
jgi:hypothetical protein